MSVTIERRPDPEGVERVLRSLPDWFGIEKAIENYVAMAANLDSFIACDAGQTVGVALVERHFPESAELTLLAVHAQHRTTVAHTTQNCALRSRSGFHAVITSKS